MLSVEVLTLFPRLVSAPLEESILGKAREKGLLRVRVTDIRDFADGKHRVTDDVPYGGGAGMVMKPEPLVAAIEAARGREPSARVILTSPQGAPFRQSKAQELADRGALILVCGRYEGVDERVLGWADEAAGRFRPQWRGDCGARRDRGRGAADSRCAGKRAFRTRRQLLRRGPAGRTAIHPPARVPRSIRAAILLSGDHGKIAQWRKEQAVARTRERRPICSHGKRLDGNPFLGDR